MNARWIMRVFVTLVSLLSLGGTAWVYVAPPPSLRIDRDGVPHFMPPVIHPETGKSLPLGQLIRHYKGEAPR